MGKKPNPTVIGAFVLGAVALAVLGLIVFGSGQYFKDTQHFVMYFPGSVNGLNVGAPVKFKGVEIGTVTNIKLVLEREKRELTIPVYVQTDPTKVTLDGEPLKMYDPARLKELIDRGLRAQLQAQSLVTGLLFVQIDFFPDTPIQLVLPQPSDPVEIPTIPTALEQASTVAREIIDELRSVQFGPMIRNASEALESLNTLVSSPALKTAVDALPGAVDNLSQTAASLRKLSDDLGGEVNTLGARVDTTLRGADQTFTSLRETAGAARILIEPGSPLDHDLRSALRDVGAAARSLSELADFLERNPTALLYGKSPPAQESKP
jgi:paraquat-inducible protein B